MDVSVGVPLGVLVRVEVGVDVTVSVAVEVGVLVDVLAGVSVAVSVTIGVLVGVRVTVLVPVSVGVKVGVAVSAGPTTVKVKSVNKVRSSTIFPLKSTIWVSRVIGAGGENCQCKIAVPGAIAHRPISATRNLPPHPNWQFGLLNAPEE